MELNAEQAKKEREMSKFNIEQIKKELVLLIDDMPVELHLGHKKTANFLSFLKSTLAVITNYEDKIFELENRLKECENGYEGTLFLDRCKLHDAEENVKKLAEENERLRGILLQFTDIVHKWGNKNGYDTSEISIVPILNEGIEYKNQIKADTVREMQERITVHATNGYPRKVRLDVIDQIAKEMVEG